MQIISLPGRFIYIAETRDWRLEVGNGHFEIQPQVGGMIYANGTNLDNLASLIVAAKAHAINNAIVWDSN